LAAIGLLGGVSGPAAAAGRSGAPLRQAPETANGPLVTVSPTLLTLAGDPATLEVSISGAPATSGFQFELLYDPAIVAIVNVGLGPFLPSTGRTVQPLGPNLDTPGRLFVGGITAGLEPAPASGDGVLVRIDVAPLGVGSSPIEISEASLVDEAGQEVAVTGGSGTITVSEPVPDKAATEYVGRAATMAAAEPAALAGEYLERLADEATRAAASGGPTGTIGEPAQSTGGETALSSAPVAETGSSGAPSWLLVAVSVIVLVAGAWIVSKRL
jgi:hypothetical protein